MLVTALLIKIESPGDILFRQIRTGKDGEPFSIFKFRSMRSDAEKDGAQWASKNDQRVTRVGKFIRLTRIDELPQLLNIFRGEMSFIGPRPERPEFNTLLEKEIPYYEMRHLVNPGLTGWAQVLYPYGASVEDSKEKLQYELYYIKNYSLLLDLQIVLKTVGVVLLGRGR
jgi:lipopolysaccharide/colanic/teichoic acid biosynthesis glycosyltransferase